MPGNKPLPLSGAPTGAGGKGACGFRAQAPRFPGPARHGSGSAGLLRAFASRPASASAAPAQPLARNAFRPLPIFSFADREAASPRLPLASTSIVAAAAYPVSAYRRLPTARHLHGSALPAVAFNPGEAAGFSAGTNA